MLLRFAFRTWSARERFDLLIDKTPDRAAGRVDVVRVADEQRCLHEHGEEQVGPFVDLLRWYVPLLCYRLQTEPEQPNPY